MARPLKQLDLPTLRKLAERQLPNREIAAIMGVDVKTLRYRFSHVIEEARSKGRSNLLLVAYTRAMKGDEKLLRFLISKTMREEFGDSLRLEGKLDLPVTLDQKKLEAQFAETMKKLRSLPALKNVSPKLIEMGKGEDERT